MDGPKKAGRPHRLKFYEKSVEMIERHQDGIATYYKFENEVALGFVDGLNNMKPVIQRRAYELLDEENSISKYRTASYQCFAQ